MHLSFLKNLFKQWAFISAYFIFINQKSIFFSSFKKISENSFVYNNIFINSLTKKTIFNKNTKNKMNDLLFCKKKWAKFEKDYIKNKYFLKNCFFLLIAFFLFSLFMALAFQKIILPTYPELHAGYGLLKGDPEVFHQAALMLAEQMKSEGFSSWSLFPQGHSGNVSLLALLYYFLFPSPLVILPLNAAAHAISAFLIFRIGRLFANGRPGKVGGLLGAILFLLFFSPLSWYGQNHKDTFVIPSVLAIVYCFLLNIRFLFNFRGLFFSGLIILCSLTIAFWMRPKYFCALLAFNLFLALLGSITVQAVVKRSKGAFCIRKILNLAFLTGLVLLFSFINAKLPERALGGEFLGGVGTEGLALEKAWRDTPPLPAAVEHYLKKLSGFRVHFAAFGTSVGAGSMVDADIRPQSAGELFSYLPRALWIGLFAPFPIQWLEKTTAVRLVGSMETFVWYLFFPGLIYLIIRKASPALWFAIMFCAGMVTIYSYVYPNLGTLYRMRFGFWMVLLTSGAVGWSTALLPLFRQVDSHKRGSHRNQLSGLNSPQGRWPRRTLGQLFSAGHPALLLTWVGFLGYFLRDLLLIRFQGMGGSLDAFLSAVMFVMVGVSCLSLPLADALSRPLQEALQAQEAGKVAQLVGEWLRVALMVLGGACLLLWLAAPRLGAAFLGDNDPIITTKFIHFFRLSLPILFLSAWTVLGNSVLNNLYKSAWAAAAQLALPLTSIFAIFVAPPDGKLQAAIFGAVLGTSLNAVAAIVLCAKHGIRLWPSRRSAINIHGPLAQNYAWLVPLAALSALAAPVNYFFASQAGVGSITLWAVAGKIAAAASQFIALAAAALVLPHLSGVFEKGRNFSGREHAYVLLIMGTWLGGFCALGLSLFADPLAGLLLSPVAGQTSVQTFAHLVRIGAMQIPVAIAAAVLVKSATVSGAIPQATWGAFWGLVLNAGLNILLVPRIGLSGIAYGALAGTMLTTLAACLGVRANFGISRSFAWLMLLGWAVWAGVIFSVEMRQGEAMAVAAAGLAVLALLQREGWRKGWIHRQDERTADVRA